MVSSPCFRELCSTVSLQFDLSYFWTSGTIHQPTCIILLPRVSHTNFLLHYFCFPWHINQQNECLANFSIDLPISLSAVKPVGDYLADAARLQAAVNSFGSSVLIQKKKFTIRTLGSAESAAQLQQLLQSSKGVDFQVSTEHPEFDKFCRVRLSKVRCYIEGIKSKGENETRPLGLLLQSDGQFQDIDFPQVPRRVSLSRSFVGDSHKIFFESALDGSAIQCDGDYGQKRDYTMQTPFTKWNASIVEDELALDDLDFSQAEGLKVEFWCEVCLRQ